MLIALIIYVVFALIVASALDSLPLRTRVVASATFPVWIVLGFLLLFLDWYEEWRSGEDE
jgi:hypothetical protein